MNHEATKSTRLQIKTGVKAGPGGGGGVSSAVLQPSNLRRTPVYAPIPPCDPLGVAAIGAAY